MDLSGSMGYTYRQELTKFEYGISLAAALGYLMIHQQDPVGVVAFDQQVTQSLPPRSKRTQLGNILSLLAKLSPKGETNVAKSLHQVAGMIRHRCLVMLFSDLLGDPEPIHKAFHRLRHAGHDVIVFHILDEAEALFPFEGMVELEDNETREKLVVDADGIKADYLDEVAAFIEMHRKECLGARIDYVPDPHGHAVRQGADELPRLAAGEGIECMSSPRAGCANSGTSILEPRYRSGDGSTSPEHATWADFASVRRDFPQADVVGKSCIQHRREQVSTDRRDQLSRAEGLHPRRPDPSRV